MSKLIEYVLARHGIIVIISSLMQMISEIKKGNLSDIYSQIEVGIKINVTYDGIISSPLT